MSLTGALSSALSGLNANARAANIVSSNLANVLTEGYGPRSLSVSAQTSGRGVSVDGVVRQVDDRLINDRRLADSELANSETKVQFATQLERLIGTPDEAGSLAAKLSEFEARLTSAASRPEAQERLQGAVLQAVELADGISAASDEIQSLRTQAETDISVAVTTINDTLAQIEDINTQIIAARSRGLGTEAFEDKRQVAIDRLAEFVPVRQVPRDRGAVALFTPGGAILLDGKAATLAFTPSNVIAPHMTVENGLLSGLTINGVAVSTDDQSGPVAGGRLAGLFHTRDTAAPDAQAQLDALARNLIERFQRPGLDSTVAAGAAGLFTDAGGAFDPANETGIAGRIRVNAQVNPAAGGALFRLRDGLGATVPGPAGNGSLLQGLADALSTSDALASGDIGSTERSASGHFGAMVSRFAQTRLSLDQSQSFASARQGELAQLEQQGGVDSDAEMQRLLLIEQAYSANARMIQTINDLMDTLLRI